MPLSPSAMVASALQLKTHESDIRLTLGGQLAAGEGGGRSASRRLLAGLPLPRLFIARRGGADGGWHGTLRARGWQLPEARRVIGGERVAAGGILRSRSESRAVIGKLLHDALRNAGGGEGGRSRRSQAAYARTARRVELFRQGGTKPVGGREVRALARQVARLDSSTPPLKGAGALCYEEMRYDGAKDSLTRRKAGVAARTVRKLALHFAPGRNYYARRAARSFARAMTEKYGVAASLTAFRNAQLNYAATLSGAPAALTHDDMRRVEELARGGFSHTQEEHKLRARQGTLLFAPGGKERQALARAGVDISALAMRHELFEAWLFQALRDAAPETPPLNLAVKAARRVLALDKGQARAAHEALRDGRRDVKLWMKTWRSGDAAASVAFSDRISAAAERLVAEGALFGDDAEGMVAADDRAKAMDSLFAPVAAMPKAEAQALDARLREGGRGWMAALGAFAGEVERLEDDAETSDAGAAGAVVREQARLGRMRLHMREQTLLYLTQAVAARLRRPSHHMREEADALNFSFSRGQAALTRARHLPQRAEALAAELGVNAALLLSLRHAFLASPRRDSSFGSLTLDRTP